MFTLSHAPLSSSSLIPPPPNFSFSLPKLKPLHKKRKFKNGTCKAEFSSDAPFAAAIGACMLSSLVLPEAVSTEEEEEEVGGGSGFDSTDARLAVMGIISFIPYFNWLSWVFAWLDTGKRRYVVYSLVYLAPYLRSNMSLSPEESWLPIASIVFGIIHVQLETSIRNGDLQRFQLFTKPAKFFSTMSKKIDFSLKGHQGQSGEERIDPPSNLPSTEKHSRDEIQQRGDPRKSSEHSEHASGNSGSDDDD